jgi:hypothetical protein
LADATALGALLLPVELEVVGVQAPMTRAAAATMARAESCTALGRAPVTRRDAPVPEVVAGLKPSNAKNLDAKRPRAVRTFMFPLKTARLPSPQEAAMGILA